MKKLEQKEQIAVIQYLEILKKQNKILTFFAIANGGSRNKLEAVNLKKEGVRAGVSDLCVIGLNQVLFIEMKKAPSILKSGKESIAGINVSDSQKAFIDAVNQNENVVAGVCYGFKQAKKFIEDNY